MPMAAIDYIDIEQLLARACMSLDWGIQQDYADCYTSDGAFEALGLTADSPHAGRHIGRPALQAFVKLMDDHLKGHCRHVITTSVIEGDGKTAFVKSYYVCVRVGVVPKCAVTLTGIYTDKVTKVRGKWLIAERLARADPQPEHTSVPDDVLIARQDRIAARVKY